MVEYVTVDHRAPNGIDPASISVKRSAFNRRRDAALSQVKKDNDYEWKAE